MDKGFGTGHVEFLGIQGGEDDVLVRPGLGFPHRPEHVREIEQDRDSGGVVVGSVVDVAVEDAEVVVVCGDEYILVRRHRSSDDTDNISSCSRGRMFFEVSRVTVFRLCPDAVLICQNRKGLKKTVPEQWDQAVCPESVGDIPCGSLAVSCP